MHPCGLIRSGRGVMGHMTLSLWDCSPVSLRIAHIRPSTLLCHCSGTCSTFRRCASLAQPRTLSLTIPGYIMFPLRNSCHTSPVCFPATLRFPRVIPATSHFPRVFSCHIALPSRNSCHITLPPCVFLPYYASLA